MAKAAQNLVNDGEGYSPVSLEKWTDMWAKGTTGWHKDDLNEWDKRVFKKA